MIRHDQFIYIISHAAYLNFLISLQAVKCIIRMVISYGGGNNYMEQILLVILEERFSV